MKRATRKIVAILTVMLLCINILPMSSFAAETAQSAEILYSGTDGDLDWSIDSNGHFYLEGIGNTDGNAGVGNSWWDYRKEIITATVNISGMTNADGLFQGMENLISLDIRGFDTSQVTKMDYMFSGCLSLETVDLSTLDTSKVESMTAMFSYCRSMKNIDLSGLDTENVTTMREMFTYCESLETIDLSVLDTANVTDMVLMFESCKSLETIDISVLDMTNVTHMNWMFSGCTALKNIDLTALETPNLLSWYGMFGYCSSLVKLDLSMLGVSKEGGSIGEGCTSLKEIVTPKNMPYDFVLPKIEPATWDDAYGNHYTRIPKNSDESITLYYKDGAYTGVDGDLTWSVDNYGHLSVEGIGDYVGKTYSSEVRPNWYEYKDKIISATIKVSETSNLGKFVSGYSNLKSASLEVSKVTDLSAMFSMCSSLEYVDLSKADTSQVTSMSDMFSGCSSLKNIDLSNLDTSQVTDMGLMFVECSSLNEINISNFNTAKVEYMWYMFMRCTSLEILDISSFDLSSISAEQNIEMIFESCTNLKKIQTPKNAIIEIALPTNEAGSWTDKNGTVYTSLPMNMSESIELRCGEWSTGVESVSGYSISLNGDIAMNFHMNLSDALIVDKEAYMLFTYPDGATSQVALADATYNSVSDTYVFSCDVSAAEMTDEIKAQIITTVGETQEYTYSVKTYADYILANTDVTEYADAAPLVKAMLNYGGYSQKQFNYNTDTLANAELYTTDTDPVLNDAVSIANTYAFTTPSNDIGLKYYGSSLLLNSKTTVRHYFTITGGESLTVIADKYTFKLEDGTILTPKMKSGMIYVDIEDINAPDLDEVFNLTVTNTATNGTIAFGYSPMTYAKYVLDYSLSGQNLVNVIKAMYWYNQAANAYFA